MTDREESNDITISKSYEEIYHRKLGVYKEILEKFLEYLKINTEKQYHYLIKKEYYVNVFHMYSICRGTIFSQRLITEYIRPSAKVNDYGYLFIWFPFLDNDNNREYTSRSNMYEILGLIKYCVDNYEIKGWVFDFRNNPGGTIEYFITIANLFIKDEFKMIGVDSKGNNNSSITMTKTNINVTIEDSIIFDMINPFKLDYKMKNVNILINNNTASAAEIITIILRDKLNATVYGERSHGIISLMQSTIYQGYTFVYPVSKLLFDDGADYITPDVEEIPYEFYPNAIKK
jgi:hypothetical protein